MKNLAGKVAVITGGASGIGKGIAAKLRENGMTVVISDIEEQALAAAAAEIGVRGLRADASSAESMRALAQQVVSEFGAVHVLCNNAGVGSTARIADMKPSDWQWLLGVNLWGVIHGLGAFLPLLRANSDGGHIVNTASMAGLAPMSGLGGYSTTKFAVVALTETLAMELTEEGSKVGVSVLCPGPVRTNLARSHRNRPADLAGGALVDVDLEQSDTSGLTWLDPTEVGEVVVRAIRRGNLYALTHPDMANEPAARQRRIAAAFRAARR